MDLNALHVELFSRIREQQLPRDVGVLAGLKFSRAISRRTLFIPIIFFMFFALFPIMIISSDHSAMLSIRATTITSAHVINTNKGGPCHDQGRDIQYTFTSNKGIDFRGVDTVCAQKLYFDVNAGDTVPVIYLNSNPAINEISGNKIAPPVAIFFIFPFFGLLMFMPLLWPRISQLFRDRKIFKAGIFSQGIVVYVAKQQGASLPGWYSNCNFEVFVRLVEANEALEVKAICTNDWLLGYLSAGMQVNVIYDAKNHKAILIENYLR